MSWQRARHGVEVERPDAERLPSVDDQATATEAAHVAEALAHQRAMAQRMEPAERGVCANCGERCLPSAVYCDADCRADHEDRLRAARRAGRSA